MLLEEESSGHVVLETSNILRCQKQHLLSKTRIVTRVTNEKTKG